MNVSAVLKFTDIARVRKLPDTNNVLVVFNFYQHAPVVIGRKQLVLILEKITREFSATKYPRIHDRARYLADECRRELWPRTV
jgi:hypothetical protein